MEKNYVKRIKIYDLLPFHDRFVTFNNNKKKKKKNHVQWTVHGILHTQNEGASLLYA